MLEKLDLVQAHEQILVSDTWDITSAVALGQLCLERARTNELPILIMVRHLGQTVFLAGLPGSSTLNENWAMRKIRLVEFFGKGSMLVRLEHEAGGISVYAKHSISEEKYAAVGGAIALRNSTGVVGVLVVSGLDQFSDHMFCVDALTDFMVPDHL
jgi:uncharacterized protein (UPF0303 family)